MTYNDWLIRRLEGCLEKGREIPCDLFAEALSAGLDVTEIERNFIKEEE